MSDNYEIRISDLKERIKFLERERSALFKTKLGIADDYKETKENIAILREALEEIKTTYFPACENADDYYKGLIKGCESGRLIARVALDKCFGEK